MRGVLTTRPARPSAVECCLPNPEIPETEQVLIARAIKLHPDDAELKKATANDYPSRFRK